jgi:hypothetical protein
MKKEKNTLCSPQLKSILQYINSKIATGIHMLLFAIIEGIWFNIINDSWP